jgi:hypothetical protein
MAAVKHLPALLALALLLAAPGALAAQEQVPEPEVAPDSLVSPVIIETPQEVAPDTTRGRPSTMGAFWKSFFVPGWGQLSTDRPGRAIFYATLQAGTVYMIFVTQGRIDEAEDMGNMELADARREHREDWIALAVFWSLASAVDAWVGAHMWGFEGEVVPPPDGSAGLALRYQVPVPGF